MAARASGSCFSIRGHRRGRGVLYWRWSSLITPGRATDGNRLVLRSCCGLTFCNSGLISPTPAWKRHSISRRCCAALPESIFHPTDEDLSAGTPAVRGLRAGESLPTPQPAGPPTGVVSLQAENGLRRSINKLGSAPFE